MTLAQLVVDLGFSSQLRTFAPALTLFFQVGEHALVAHAAEMSSAGTGVSDAP